MISRPFRPGGYSAIYVKKHWNQEKLENTSILSTFEELLIFDLSNGADLNRIFQSILINGGFHLIKVILF
jgi:hypothetical protein